MDLLAGHDREQGAPAARTARIEQSLDGWLERVQAVPEGRGTGAVHPIGEVVEPDAHLLLPYRRPRGRLVRRDVDVDGEDADRVLHPCDLA